MNKFWKAVIILGITAGIVFIVLPVLAFVCFIFIGHPLKFVGNSMLPNYKNGQYWMTNKIAYKFSKPQRGDVVVFLAPPDNKDEFAKRIVGLPGETIEIRKGKVYINDSEIKEEYLNQDVFTSPGSFLKGSTKVEIPQDNYAVLGDQRDHSLDSRNFGFLPAQNIIAKFWFCYSNCN